MKLTDEQLDIIRHDINAHAKVLAVAGSGKTTTEVERADYLVRSCEVPQRAIRIVMFNKSIQEDFDRTSASKNNFQGERGTLAPY
jgi:DNA helicase-2/ATP-dependent DNA helicase PcrA